jgi:hypothetical protein
MSYELRTISLRAEVIHPPIQLRPEVVQGIHNSLYRQSELSYQNFQIAADGIHLTNIPQSPGQASVATFLPDRLVIREELRPCTVEEFATRVVNVASIGFQALGITSTLAQQFVVRSLVTPRHVEDGRVFLMERLLQAGPEVIEGFGRPVQSAGVRLVFPQTENSKEVFQVRVESWPQDPRSIWLENVGSFAFPTQVENLPHISNYLYATYKFMTGPLGRFLAHYDHP